MPASDIQHYFCDFSLFVLAPIDFPGDPGYTKRVVRRARGKAHNPKGTFLKMATSNVTPVTDATPAALNAEGIKKLTRQKGYFDLDTMEDVLLFKQADFKPVTDTAQALERLGNDASRFLAIVNEGLEAEAGRALMADSSIPFLEQDETGVFTPFAGTTADPATVNPLILNLAKMFGYPSGQKGPEAKAKKDAAKAQAIELIKNTPAIREGLKTAATPKA